MDNIVVYAPSLGVVGLVVIWFLYGFLSKQDAGSQKMQDIAALIREGANAYMRRQMMYVLSFVALVGILLFFFLKPYNAQSAIAYVCGALTSMLCGLLVCPPQPRRTFALPTQPTSLVPRVWLGR